MTIVRQLSIDELFLDPSFKELTDEYAAESKIEEMPSHNLDKLIGFVAILLTVVPHYSVKIASTESIFVASANRKGGAGIKLLRVAEAFAKEQGAINLFVNAPAESRLAQVLPSVGYRESHRMFCRKLI